MLQTAVLAFSLLLGSSAFAAAAITECDRLATSPEDPDGVAPGVEREDVNLEAAIKACEQARAAHPAELRFRYQLARVLFYSGQNERAVREMRETADAGYRQAQFVYGAMISNGRDKAPKDMCLVEKYWLSAARAGRQAARISYVRHVLKSRFDGCPIQASRDEQRQLLAIASQNVRDHYYEKLLIEDLIERLESSAPAR